MRARIISKNYDYINVRGLDLVKNLKWNTFKERQDYLTASLMFKCIHGKAPYYLSDNITMLCDILPYNTRNIYNMNVYVPQYRTQHYATSFSVNGPKVWNNLPNIVKDSVSIYQFKKLYKQSLLNL